MEDKVSCYSNIGNKTMIKVTGDIHSDFTRIYDFIKKASRGDILILLGDVGINILRDYSMDGEMIEREIKKKIDSECQFRGVQVACVHGNHERRPETVSTYAPFEWHGGVAYREDFAKNIVFLKEGEVYNISGQTFLVCGGAWSADRKYRMDNGLPWYEDEQPSEIIKQRVEETLNKVNWCVDYMLTHTCPYRFIPDETITNKCGNPDRSTELWLDSIEKRLNYRSWYCGHWHCDKQIEKINFLYNTIIFQGQK